MTSTPSTIGEPTTFSICNDFQAIRRTLQTVRESYHFTKLCLFGRRNAARALDYLERRSRDRRSVAMPLYIISVQFDGEVAQAHEGDPCELFAMSKDVSLRGLGFTHDEPFEAEYAIVTFDLLQAPEVALLVELRWRNRSQGDQYTSGGRFIGIAEKIGD